jgi:hypothetical protein
LHPCFQPTAPHPSISRKPCAPSKGRPQGRGCTKLTAAILSRVPTDEKPTNEMVRRLIPPRKQEDRGGSF